MIWYGWPWNVLLLDQVGVTLTLDSPSLCVSDWLTGNIKTMRKSWEEQAQCLTHVLYWTSNKFVSTLTETVDPPPAIPDLFVAVKFKLLFVCSPKSSLLESRMQWRSTWTHCWYVVLPKQYSVLQAVFLYFPVMYMLTTRNTQTLDSRVGKDGKDMVWTVKVDCSTRIQNKW